jgi:teichuronic acid biosynthesis glycosyltransferase TuaC
VQRLRATFPFDLIDAHYAFPDGAAAVLLGRRFAVPVCVTLRGGDIDVLARFRARRRMIRQTLQRADRVFAVSHHLADGAAALGVDREHVQVLANGVDCNKFYPVNKRVARRSLSIRDDERLLLCVGNLVAEKGHHVLIEALACFQAREEPVPNLVIVGSHQRGQRAYQEQLERRIVALNLGNRVRIIGSIPQDELRNWYSAADVVVLPTFREGCPNVVREALACGAPVVASRVGGVPELVTSDALGFLVQPGDARSFAQAISKALQRRWDGAAIVAAAGERTWQTVAMHLAAEFNALIQAPLVKGHR